MSPAERAWQTMHTIETSLKLSTARLLIRAFASSHGTHALLGGHPEPESVIAWGIAASVARYLDSRWLDSRDWPDGVKLALRSVDLSHKGYTVARNHDAGIRPFGDNLSCAPDPFFMPDARPIK